MVFEFRRKTISKEIGRSVNTIIILTDRPQRKYSINSRLMALQYWMGIVKCLIEKAYNEGKTDFKKPISCHLYPIRETKTSQYFALNYEPRETLCAPACALGKKEGVKVYQFLKEPLIRKYGEAFYNALDHIAQNENA